MALFTWKNLSITTVSDIRTIAQASQLLYDLAKQLPGLRYRAALHDLPSYGLDKDSEIQFLHLKQEGAIKEANFLKKAADALVQLQGTEIHQVETLDEYMAKLETDTTCKMEEDCNEKKLDPEECPQGHHKLEGECKFDYCRCSCVRCKIQCERNGY